MLIPVTDTDREAHWSTKLAPRHTFAKALVTQNRSGIGRRRLLFPAIFLVYLLATVSGINHHSHGVWAVVGYVALVLFSLCYLASLPARWNGNDQQFWFLYWAMIALTVIEVPLAHEGAFVMLIYIAILGMATGARWALPVAGVFALLSLVLPPLITPWHAGVDTTTAASLALVSLAMWSFFGIIHTNHALEEARAEVAVLAAEGERNRIARDLHDLLGHSLTTITVKAGLAKRLAEQDPARAAIEIGEVEELARRSLTDVRAAVSNYRMVTLATELATAQEVLRATGIDAQVLSPTEVVDADLQGLFGWVVREGTINVVRHSRATKCTITLAPRSIEITDNGSGRAIANGTSGSDGADATGTGIRGLRERLESVGGTLDTGVAPGGGWRIAAAVP
jgi:two-component system, NarL family, sensor histidine kinase DesK